jgi:hypothetical protein
LGSTNANETANAVSALQRMLGSTGLCDIGDLVEHHWHPPNPQPSLFDPPAPEPAPKPLGPWQAFAAELLNDPNVVLNGKDRAFCEKMTGWWGTVSDLQKEWLRDIRRRHEQARASV